MMQLNYLIILLLSVALYISTVSTLKISFATKRSHSNTVLHSTSMSLTDRIINCLHIKYPHNNDRVLTCFQKFSKGEELDVFLGDSNDQHNRQKANCYVNGLTTKPFHDINNGKFPWALELESHSHIVMKELENFLLSQRKKGSEEERWLGPRFQGNHYGTEWKTLGLQDRGLWDGDNVESFPLTVKLLSQLKVPSCEAFFARQGPNSGIQPHSDLNNFILTAHLAVDVPVNQSYIRVGDEVKYWENGKVMVFDTSIFHSTKNEGITDRYVLLIRFWHPDLTEQEKDAFSFIFSYLDHANMGENALQLFEMEEVHGIGKATTSSKGNRPLGTKEKKTKEKAPKGKGFHRGG